MRYILILPKQRTIEITDSDLDPVAFIKQHLPPDTGLDHGSLAPGVGIFVDEFGLLKPPAEQHFFALGPQLFANPAVIYQSDDQGETASVSPRTAAVVEASVRFFASPDEVEQAISAKIVRRPQSAINGEVFWQWTPDQQDSTPNLGDQANGHS